MSMEYKTEEVTLALCKIREFSPSEESKPNNPFILPILSRIPTSVRQTHEKIALITITPFILNHHVPKQHSSNK